MYSSSRDNWERLVSAVVRREQIWQMFHDHSRNPSTIESESDDEDFTSLLRFSSNRAISVTNPSTSKVGKNGIGSLTRKLFAALYPNQKPNHQDYVDVLGKEHAGVTRFSLHELLIATDNFSNKNILEDRGSWSYKLYIGQLANGCVVAVKRIVKGDSGNGHRTFQPEVEAMSIVVHPNVLSLLGICSTPREKLLILPLMVNGSVDSWLRDRLDSRAPLDWAVRQRIAVGVAKGLAYLHGECERKIIHCDVKAANIYLNEDFEAVIGNFCIATFMDHSVTHVTAVVRGTIGHIAPEYLQSGTCSEQTDVFSYGIFLLELITGQRTFDLARLANDEDVMLLDWVKSAVKEGQGERIVDPEVGSNYIEEWVEQLTKIALVCTDTNPERRPRMLDIVRMLQFGDGLYKMWEEWCTGSPIQPEMIQLTLSPRESVQLSSPR